MKNQSVQTRLIHEGGHRRSSFGELSEALVLTQSYVYKTAEEAERRFSGEEENESYIYSRYGNPTVATFEDRMAALEGVDSAFATASGMAAVSGACLSLLRKGDHVVSSRALFGSCFIIMDQILPRFGIDVTFVDGSNIDDWVRAVRPETKMVFFETPSNPLLEIVDIKAVSEIAHSVGAMVMVDNVMSTPVFQRPISLGADIVVYSATKHVDGQGRCLGGVILGSNDFIKGTVEPFMRHTGGSLSPFNAWVMLKGLETIELRCREQEKTATLLADWLSDMPHVISVRHTGSKAHHPQYELIRKQMSGDCTMLSFYIQGGKRRTFSFMNKLETILISNNLGDAKTIITHPYTTTHSKMDSCIRDALGITPNLLRISCGLESLEDIQYDISRAFDLSLEEG